MSDTNERIAKFAEIMNGNAHSELVTDIMVNNLAELGFFTAPASTKYHGAVEGGLFEHSLAVTEALVNLTDKLGLEWQLKRSPYMSVCITIFASAICTHQKGKTATVRRYTSTITILYLTGMVKSLLLYYKEYLQNAVAVYTRSPTRK